ncbi:MAG: cupin domain-containing protein [Bacteroidota bacterium]
MKFKSPENPLKIRTDKVSEYVNQLNLQPHPEGGFYRETYRSENLIHAAGFEKQRNVSTGIYYLLETGSFSAFHRIKSDEMWHFYDGTGLSVYFIDERGDLEVIRLGRNIGAGEQLQGVVPAGRWFASRVESEDGFALVGCTVAPGFDFEDFEMAKRENLKQEFPQHSDLIISLTR